jgi:AraC family transcriptional regulator
MTLEQCCLAPADVVFSPLPMHLITWNIGAPGTLQRIENRHTQTIWMMKGGITLTPAGQPRHWCWDHSATVLYLQLQPELINQMAIASDVPINQLELIERFGVYDPQLELLGNLLLTERQSGGLAGQLYLESLINLLVIHLLRHHATTGRSHPQMASQISPSRLKQVIAYIHDNLGQSLSLSDLASLANLSPSRFTRIFRQETGLPPHQYLIHARIEQATHLLRSGGDLSIGEIAYRVGFTDQSHFTRHFKRIVGVTPSTVLQDGKKVLKRNLNIQD